MGVLRKLGFKNKVERSVDLVADHLRELYQGKVAHGPFKGMQLPRETWWGTKDACSKLIGVYEKQVQDKLESLAPKASVLIDIGAADGYFAVGAVRSGLYQRAICFEISERGRQRLRANAELNGVAENIEIVGEANHDTLAPVLADIDDGLILCDIEGAEFDLLSEEVLRSARHFHFIVELHDAFVANGDQRRSQLLDRTNKLFDTEIIRSADIQVSAFRELDRFNDTQRLLAFNEGRGAAMEWLVLIPRMA